MKTSVDFYQHIATQINALKFFGLWYIPHALNSLWYWIRIVIIIIVVFFAFIVSTGGQIVYLVRLILSGNSSVMEVTGIINLVFTELLAEYRLLDVHLRQDVLSKLVKELHSEDFQCHSQPEKKICERAIKKSKQLFIALIFGASMDILVHVVVVPGLDKFDNLPLKMELLLFDVYDPEYFKYVCAYQVQILYKPFMVTTFIAIHTMPWAAMLFIMSQLDVLIYNFGNMKELVKSTRIARNCDGNEAFRLIFRKFVFHHSAIIRFINIYQAMFGRHVLAYLFVSATVVCTTALQFFSIDSPSKHITDVLWLFAYVIIFVAMLFVDCYLGNAITSKCEHLSTCVYSSEWLPLNTELKKIVLIFLAKTQQPIVITAFKLVPVSLQTFAKVMNWTYKGFAVMNQTK